MNNILFWVLIYLIVGCVYVTIWWIFTSEETIQRELSVMERYGVTPTNRMLLAALAIDMVINIVIWPFDVTSLIITIVRIIKR